MKSVLCAAYYDLHTCMRNPVAFFLNANKGAYQASQVANHLAPLCAEHHVAFAQGSIHLRSVAVDMLRQGLPARFESCDVDGCGKGARDWLTQQFLVHSDSGDLLFDPLYSFQNMRKSAEALQKSGRSPLCEDCQRDLPRLMNASRHYIWDQLPYFFNVKARKEGTPYGYDTY